jgi:hypothetical protein
MSVPKGDDEEFDMSHISAMCAKTLHGRRGKYLLFVTHFRDDDIPAPVEQGPSNYGVTILRGDAAMARVCQDARVHPLHARLSIVHSRVLAIAAVKEPRPRRSASRLASLICKEEEGTSSVTSIVMQQYIAWAPAGGAAVVAPEGVRLHARRHLPLPPRGGRWLHCSCAMLGTLGG